MFLRGAPTVTPFAALEDEPTNIQSFETHLPEGCWVQTFWDPHCSDVEGLTSVLAEEASEILIHPPVLVQRFLTSILNDALQTRWCLYHAISHASVFAAQCSLLFRRVSSS